MTASHPTDRLSAFSVPVIIASLVGVVLLVAPPLATAGRLPIGEAYLLALVLVILAVSLSFPYAVLIATVTLPLLWFDTAGFLPPGLTPLDESPTIWRAVGHVALGIFYGVLSAIVGVMFIGVALATPSAQRDSRIPLGEFVGGFVSAPIEAIVGGLVMGGVFVMLQLWRYRVADVRVTSRILYATVVLGGLLSLSPMVAYWLFGTKAAGL